MSLRISRVGASWAVTARYRNFYVTAVHPSRSDALQRAMSGAFFGRWNGEVN